MYRRHLTPLLVLGLLSCATAQDKPLAFVHGTVYDGTKADPLPDGVVPSSTSAATPGPADSVHFLTGIKALLLIGGVLYLLAMLTRLRGHAMAARSR